METKTIADIKRVDKLPEGWKFFDSPTAPIGWKWASNGKSRFSKEYDHVLVKI